MPDRLMDRRDEVGKLAGGELVVADVFAHDLGREVWVVFMRGFPKSVCKWMYGDAEQTKSGYSHFE